MATGAFTVRDLLILASYHRHVILIAFLAAVVAGFAAALLAPRNFEAQGRMMVLSTQSGGAAGVLGLPSFFGADGARSMEAELEILRSRAVLLDVVAAIGPERLYPDSTIGGLFERLLAWRRSLPSIAIDLDGLYPENMIGNLVEWLESWRISLPTLDLEPPYLGGSVSGLFEQLPAWRNPFAGAASEAGVAGPQDPIGGPVLRSPAGNEPGPAAAGQDDRHLDAAARLESQLRATAAASSNTIQVRFSHPDRDLAIELVDVVIIAYLSRRQEIYEELNSPFLLAEVARYRGALERVEDEIQRVKAHYDLLDLPQEILLAVNQVDSITQRQRHVLERREALEAEVAAAQTRLSELPPRVGDFWESTDRADGDEARSRLLLLQVERANLAERYSDSYPRLREIDEELAAVRQFMASDRPIYSSQREIRNPSLGFLTNHLITLQLEQGALDRQVEELERQRRDTVERVAELRLAERELRELERSRDISARIYNEYALQAESARIEEDAIRQRHSNVRVVDWASASARGHSMGLNLAVGGVFGGLLLAGLAGLAAAWNRQVFVVPGEAERTLEMPMLAIFNEHQETGSLPGGPDDVAFLATRILDHQEDDQPLRSLQFLPADDGSRQPSLVLALARELAASHGRRVLLLDLHAAARDQPAAGAGTSAGGRAAGGGPVGVQRWSEPLRREQIADIDLEQADVPGLWVSRATGLSPIGLTRTELRRLREIVAVLTAAFDVVIIDMPAYAASHLGLRLAAAVDASVLVLRAEATRGPVAARVRDEILAAGGDILGAVMTGRRFHLPRTVYRWL